MLCVACRRQLERGATACSFCGRPASGASRPLELVLHDGARVSLAASVTIGRARGNTIQLSDPRVSRFHARIVTDGGVSPELEDVGSTAGTFVDGGRVTGRIALADGSRIRVGESELRIERPAGDDDAGRTIFVPPDSSIVVDAVRPSTVEPYETTFGLRPRVRPGWALKRLDAAEGERRVVLKDLRGGRFVRMSDEDAELFQLLDGLRSLPDLVAEAERLGGAAGRLRLAALLSDLGDRGMLEGVEGRPQAVGPSTRLARMFRPRERTVPWAGPLFVRVYRAGGFLLFTRPALALAAVTAVVGAGVFVYLVIGSYGTPFVVASRIGLGGLVFLVGRMLLVACHELAHGLTVVSFGRRVERAGIKTILVFPYVFVDTSNAWFEPRRRRLAISAAGPASDFVLGGVFSLAALAASAGTPRDILFNIAFAAYVGAFVNLNPVLERDGYHLLVDLLREPGLRLRAQAWLKARLRGASAPVERPTMLRLYGAATILWSLSGLLFAVILTQRYYAELTALAPRAVVLGAFAVIYALALVPVLVLVGGPIVARFKTSETKAEGVRAA